MSTAYFSGGFFCCRVYAFPRARSMERIFLLIALSNQAQDIVVGFDCSASVGKHFLYSFWGKIERERTCLVCRSHAEEKILSFYEKRKNDKTAGGGGIVGGGCDCCLNGG